VVCAGELESVLAQYEALCHYSDVQATARKAAQAS
jgi:hypothetical protein